MLERGPHHEPPFALSARAARPSLDFSDSREVCLSKSQTKPATRRLTSL